MRIVPPDRKIKNRQAAQVSRNRQKEKLKLLEEENLMLRLENKRLRDMQWDLGPSYSQCTYYCSSFLSRTN
jgi:regulator of replication initiation timing